MRHAIFARTPALVAVAALLGACGDSGGSALGEAGTRGVIASASDCVAFGPGAVDACAKAIERAVSSHEASTQAYAQIESCESAAGAGMCERAASGMYRPRLSAFLVTVGETTRAEPLYPAEPGTVGFRTANKSAVAANDRSVTFSRLALSVAESQASAQGGKKTRNNLAF